MNETLKQVKDLIKDLKAQKRDNARDMKYFAKGAHQSSYAMAAHLASCNETLDSVIEQLQDIVDDAKK
jgi:hypothetical protein